MGIPSRRTVARTQALFMPNKPGLRGIRPNFAFVRGYTTALQGKWFSEGFPDWRRLRAVAEHIYSSACRATGSYLETTSCPGHLVRGTGFGLLLNTLPKPGLIVANLQELCPQRPLSGFDKRTSMGVFNGADRQCIFRGPASCTTLLELAL